MCTQVYTELIGQIRFSKLLSLFVISVEHVLLNLLCYHFTESKTIIIIIITLPAVLFTLSLHKYRIYRFLFFFGIVCFVFVGFFWFVCVFVWVFFSFFFWGGVAESDAFQYKPFILEMNRLSSIFTSKTCLLSK